MTVTRCKTRSRSTFVIAAALGCLVLLATAASAHLDPAGSNGTGVGQAVSAFTDADCTIPLVGPISECTATIYYQARLILSTAATAFEGGTWNMTLPGATVVPLGVVPCVGDTALVTTRLRRAVAVIAPPPSASIAPPVCLT